jgi:hypothetical protein
MWTITKYVTEHKSENIKQSTSRHNMAGNLKGWWQKVSVSGPVYKNFDNNTDRIFVVPFCPYR